MSHEVFVIVQGMDLKNIETQLALQCAPLITGLKISNLLNVTKQNEVMVRTFLKKAEISYYCLLRTDSKVIFLLFNRNKLEQYLLKNEARELLADEGYTEFTLGKVLRTFQKRYQKHMEEKKDFPHEMGILLGYPIGDVKGFIEHKGKNFLHSGYWKVYENERDTVLLFQQFEHAKETLIRMLSSGISMQQIIKSYRENSMQCAIG